MKKLMLMIGILAVSISFATENPSLKNEIIEQVNPDLSSIELDEIHQDFVVVSFYIKDFQIHITDIQGSQQKLIRLITSELLNLYIHKEYSITDVFNYKFTFKKS